MNFDSPPAVFTGAECAQVARHLREALRLAYLAQGLRPPAALVAHADTITRAAEQFRATWQAKTGSGIVADAVVVEPSSFDQAGKQLPVAYVAKTIGVSESYITRMLRGGNMAGSRSGPRGSWLVDAASAAAYAATRRTGGDDDG